MSRSRIFNMFWFPHLLIIFLEVHKLSAECTLGRVNSYYDQVRCISVDETEIMSFIINKSFREMIIENSSLPHVEMIPHNLYSLTIRKSGVSTFLSTEFPTLRYLDLSFNSIHDMSFLRNIDLLDFRSHHNQIAFLNGSDLHYTMYLDLSYNNIQNSTQLECGLLRYLNLSHNSIERLDNLLSKLVIVETIDLSYNHLKIVAANETENLEFLKFMNLSNNNIKSLQYKNDPNRAVWTSYNKIGNDFLDLSSNRIEFFSDMFANCRNQGYYLKSVNLSNNNLPDLYFLLTNESRVIHGSSLIFSENEIRKLYPYNFRGFIIRKLDLSRNSIESIPSSTFEGLQVTELLLDQNKITSLNHSSLAGLSGLTKVNLSFNPLTNIDELIFRNISRSLSSVDLSHCRLKNIPVTLFMNMKSLDEIYLGHNLIETVEPATFSHLKVKILDLSYNRIKILAAYIFADMNINKILDISFNPLEIIENIFNNTKIGNISLRGISLYELSDKKLKGLENFEYLDLSNTSIEKLENNTFDHMPFLETLILDQNSIEIIPSNFFSFNKKLRYLSIVNNPVSLISIDSFPHKMNLKYLNLTLNGSILKERFYNLMYLEELHFVDSIITIIQKNSFKGLINLRTLDFDNSTILDIEKGAFLGLDRVVKLDVRTLFANATSLKSGILYGLKSLESLNFTSMILTAVEDRTFHGLNSLLNLSLSHNKIQNLAKYAFEGLNNLQLLDLSSNKLDRLPLGIFKDLSGLTKLNLQDNQLSDLDFGVFSNMSHLNILNLSFNQLHYLVDELFFPLTSLQVLDINSNLITWFGYELTLKHTFLRTIGIGKNKCSCRLISHMLSDFKTRGVDYTGISYLTLESRNVDGIACF